MSNRKKLTIGVTGLNAIDSPGPGIPVIRGIRESKDIEARIIGFAYESLEPGIYMRDLVDKTYHLPYPSAGTEVLLDRIQYIHSKEKLDVIIPNFDAELFPMMRIEVQLASMGIKTYLPTIRQFEERLKVNLTEFGRRYNIPVPYSRAIYSAYDIPTLVNDFVYPIVVKGQHYDAHIAYNADQTETYFRKISAKWGLPIIVQQYIHGTEFNVTGLGDGMGNTIAAVPMRKQYITDKGKAWGGITIDDKNILDLTRHFIKSTKWRGGFELELLKDSNNQYNLLEINPRLPAWVYLSVGAGQNIPEALVKLALGEKVAPFETYQVGKMFVRYAYDMIVDVEDYHKVTINGEL